MLVLDVDGTLLNDNKEVSKRTLATLRKVQQMGVRIMLASGRPTYGLLGLAKMLELDTYNGYVMAYNGGQVIRAADGEVIFERRINPELIPYLEKKADKNGFGILTYNEDCIVTNMPDNPHIKAEAELNGMKIVYEEHFSIAIDFIPCKCMLVSDDEEALVGLENHWKRRLDGVLDVFRSEPFFLEVVGCRVNKANTLAAVMEMEGIKTDDIVVFGDGVADVTMLQLASLGIAMGNAPGSVKRCADYITLSNNEDGVAVAVDSLVSMNMWGLTPDFLITLEEGFKEFFEKEVPGNPLKAEYLIPIFIGELLEQSKMSVKVCHLLWHSSHY